MLFANVYLQMMPPNNEWNTTTKGEKYNPAYMVLK